MDKIEFSTKANTLQALFHLAELNVVPLYIISFKDWKKDYKAVLKDFESFVEKKVLPYCKDKITVCAESFAVRSSCTQEDSKESSLAGAFCSLLNIAFTGSDGKLSLKQAIDTVFASYSQCIDTDQIFIQPMIKAVLSGVLTTRVLTDGSPYYVINYDDETGKTDTITSGVGVNKTVYVYRDVKKSDFDSKRLLSIVTFAKKIEEICGSDTLDIEFCIDKDGIIYLLQVRPLCTQNQWIETLISKLIAILII